LFGKGWEYATPNFAQLSSSNLRTRHNIIKSRIPKKASESREALRLRISTKLPCPQSVWSHHSINHLPNYDSWMCSPAEKFLWRECTAAQNAARTCLTTPGGAKGIAVLHHLPIFRQFFHFHKNLSSSVISGTFSRENRFPPKPKKRPKIAKHTKHEPLPKRDAISLKFP
jgi:hypothetical protein